MLSQIKTEDTHSLKTTPTKMSQPTHKAILLEPPAGAESEFPDDSTLDKDVFDGIDDIYLDLEASPPPPPPSSKEDIASAMVNTSTSSSASSSSSTSSVGINKLDVSKEDTILREPEIPYTCGVPQNTSKLVGMWNTLTGAQCYVDINGQAKDQTKKQKNVQNVKQPSTPTRVIDRVQTPPKPGAVLNNSLAAPNTGVENAIQLPAAGQDGVIKMRVFTDEDMPPATPIAPTTIIHHVIDEPKPEPEPKPSFVDRIRLSNPFASRDEPALDGDEENTADKSRFMDMLKDRKLFGSSGDEDDEESIRRKKMEKYKPSFWTVLGQRKTCGVSQRLLLLVAINLFALMLLIILITQFAGQKDSVDSDAQANIDAPVIEEPQPENELRKLCGLDGITKEDGIILTGNQVMEKGQFFCSPSKTYLVGMMDDFAIANIDTNEVIWTAGVTDGERVVLLEDGSMIIQDDKGEVIWSSGAIPDSAGFYNHQLVFWEDNEGIIALQQTPTMGVSATPYNFWMAGDPQFEICEDCQSKNLKFPVRGTFYFPTFDGTERAWQGIGGQLPMHFPSMGFYSSSDPSVATAHIEAMEYGNINLGIASWLGAGVNYDRSRITMLLDETVKQNADLKWTISYEPEQLLGAVNEDQIQGDLEYLKKWFAGHKSWARMEGKPVLYVNNEGNCDATERWMTAAADWYVVLKVFDRSEDCEYQPDSWYDNSINDNNDGVDIREGLYHNLAPGHWQTGGRRPDLERLSPREWCLNVQDMVQSSEQWHLITSFNDRDRGTAIEPSLDWRSNSRFGFFLDCLHDPLMF